MVTLIHDMLDDLTFQIQSMLHDAEKFDEKNNKAAGTRIRIGLQSIKKECQNIRVAIQDRKSKM